MKRILTTLAALGALLSLQGKTLPVNLVPQPREMTLDKGTFKVPGAPVSYDILLGEPSAELIRAFAGRISMLTGESSKVSAKALKKGFVFSRNPAIPAEGYDLIIDGKAVKVAVSDYKGLVNALATIAQLMPEDFFRDATAPKAEWQLPQLSIKDARRLG